MFYFFKTCEKGKFEPGPFEKKFNSVANENETSLTLHYTVNKPIENQRNEQRNFQKGKLWRFVQLLNWNVATLRPVASFRIDTTRRVHR